MGQKKTILITGITGLVGSYLSKIMLQNGFRVYGLARSKDNQSARERVLKVLEFWGEDFVYGNYENLIVLEGDVTDENLGLDEQTLYLLKSEVDEIYHSAAVTRFNWTMEDIRVVNVGGTRNVLELALTCSEEGKLKKVNHISTAYICGDYRGAFREDNLDVGQRFNNSYEQSKFEAEQIVEEYRVKKLWIDIFRPPLIIGESATGKTITFEQSVYQLLHMLNLEIFDCFPGENLFMNIVFVDDFCSALHKISSWTTSLNKNYHPFSYTTIPFETILDITSEFLRVSKPKLISRYDFLSKNSTPAQKILLRNNILLISNHVTLDSRNTNDVLNHIDFEFTCLNRDAFMKQLLYCKKNGFLKINDKDSNQLPN